MAKKPTASLLKPTWFASLTNVEMIEEVSVASVVVCVR